jgi:hypothetical protein
VTDQAARAALVKRVLAVHGRIDVLVTVPRVGGLVRLARVQPVGALLDVVSGRFGRAITSRVTGLEREQAQGVPAR